MPMYFILNSDEKMKKAIGLQMQFAYDVQLLKEIKDV